MMPTQALDKAVRILDLIDLNVKHALKLQAYFCRAAYKDDIGAWFDNSKAAPGYIKFWIPYTLNSFSRW